MFRVSSRLRCLRGIIVEYEGSLQGILGGFQDVSRCFQRFHAPSDRFRGFQRAIVKNKGSLWGFTEVFQSVSMHFTGVYRISTKSIHNTAR